MLKQEARNIAEVIKATGIEVQVNRDFTDETSYYIGAYDPVRQTAFAINSVAAWEARARAMGQLQVFEHNVAFTALLGEMGVDLLDCILVANDPNLDEEKQSLVGRMYDWRTYCYMTDAAFMALALEHRVALVAMGKYKANQEEYD